MAQDEFLFVSITGDRKLLRDIESIPDIVRVVLREKFKNWLEMTRDKVIENINERLKQKTGELAQSVEIEFTEEGLKFEGRVYIAGSPYARAQESGKLIPPHHIRTRNAKVMAFMAASGDKVFATRVFHPGGVIPPHYFMRDAYRFISPRITRGLRYYIVERLRKRFDRG